MNDKKLREQARTCDRADELLELYGKMVGVGKWPTKAKIIEAVQGCLEWASQYAPLDKSAREEADRYIAGDYQDSDAAGTLYRFATLAAQAYHAATNAADGYYEALQIMAGIVRCKLAEA